MKHFRAFASLQPLRLRAKDSSLCPITITENNLRILIDTLVSEGARVVGPKAAGDMTLYEPLQSGAELVLGKQPRNSAKETFFPLCEDILSYEKKEGKMTVADVDPPAFPKRSWSGPCPATRPPPAFSMRSSPGTTRTSSTWSGARRRPSSALPVPRRMMPASAPPSAIPRRKAKAPTSS